MAFVLDAVVLIVAQALHGILFVCLFLWRLYFHITPLPQTELLVR